MSSSVTLAEMASMAFPVGPCNSGHITTLARRPGDRPRVRDVHVAAARNRTARTWRDVTRWEKAGRVRPRSRAAVLNGSGGVVIGFGWQWRERGVVGGDAGRVTYRRLVGTIGGAQLPLTEQGLNGGDWKVELSAASLTGTASASRRTFSAAAVRSRCAASGDRAMASPRRRCSPTTPRSWASAQTWW